MGSKNDLTRKDFLTLTFTLIGTTAAAAACSSSNNTTDGGTTGAGGRGGTTGAGGTSHSTGQGGAGGQAGASSGGAGGTSTSSCADPLPQVQAASDHTHSVTIHPSVLDSTSAQMFDTSAVLGHMHIVTLQPTDLAMIKGGGSVMTMTSSAGTPAHTHVFTISCH